MKSKTNSRVRDVVNCTVCEWVISGVGGAYKSNRTLYESALKSVEFASVAAAGLARIRAENSVEGDPKHPNLNKFLSGLMTNEGAAYKTRRFISETGFWALAQAVNHWPVLFAVRDAVCHEAEKAVEGALLTAVDKAICDVERPAHGLNEFLKTLSLQ